jgi:hypothetical protein
MLGWEGGKVSPKEVRNATDGQVWVDEACSLPPIVGSLFSWKSLFTNRRTNEDYSITGQQIGPHDVDLGTPR